MIIQLVLLLPNGRQKSEHSEYGSTLGGLKKDSSSDDKSDKYVPIIPSFVYPWLYHTPRACAPGSVEDSVVHYWAPLSGLGHQLILLIAGILGCWVPVVEYFPSNCPQQKEMPHPRFSPSLGQFTFTGGSSFSLTARISRPIFFSQLATFLKGHPNSGSELLPRRMFCALFLFSIK